MSSRLNTGNALSAHELFKDEHRQIAQGIKAGLDSTFPMISESGRIRVEIDNVFVDKSKDKAQEANYLNEARYRGQSYSMPVKATVSVYVDGQLSDKKDLKIGNYYPVAEGLGARLIEGKIYQNKYQIRRKPGVYPFRNDRTSLIEFNTSHGRSFNFAVDFDKKDTPTFDIRVTGAGASTIRRGVYVLMRMMGVSDAEASVSLGSYYKYNAFQTEKGDSVNGQPIDLAKESARVFRKLIPEYDQKKTLGDKKLESMSFNEISQAFQEWSQTGDAFEAGVVKDTIGVPSSKVNKDVVLNAASKLTRIYDREEEPEHRFAEKYRKLHGIPTQIREGLIMDKKLVSDIKTQVKRNLELADKPSAKAGKVKAKDLLGSTPEILKRKIESSFTQSELSTTTETNNILDIDTRSKEVTIKGPGGIQSGHAIQPDTIHLHPSRLGLTDFLKTQAAAPGVTVPLANGATFSSTGEIHRLLFDRKTGKVRSVSSEEADKGGVGFSDDFEVKKIGGKSTYKAKQRQVFAAIGDDVKKVDEKEVRYVLLDMSHAFSDTVNLIPFLNHNSGPRAIFGSNQMTQALAMTQPEAPLVQTLDESGKTFGKRIGERYNITAKASGEVVKVTPTNIIIKEFSGMELSHPVLKDFPLNQGGFIDMQPIVKVGDRVKKGDLLTRSNYTDEEGELAIGKNLRTAYMAYKGYNFEDGIVISETAAKKLSSDHIDEFVFDVRDHIKMGVKAYLGAFQSRGKTVQNRGNIEESGTVRQGATVNEGDHLIVAVSKPNLKNDPEINAAMESMFEDLDFNVKDVSLRWEKPFPGKVVRVVTDPTRIRVFVKSTQPFKEGDKLSAYHGNKGIVAKVLPDDMMPKTPGGEAIEVMVDPHGIPSRANPGQVFELAAGRIAKKRNEPYKIRNFHGDNAKAVFDDMEKEGLKDKEKLTFPDGSSTVEPVAWGYEYMGKLKHQLDKKFSVRGINDPYDLDQQPIGGASIDNLTVYAMIGHNARANLAEMTNLKGTENHEFWTDLANNDNPRRPVKVPYSYRKFEAMMKGLGVNVQKEGGDINLFPMTDSDVLKMSNGQLTESGRFKPHRAGGPDPYGKGLFDQKMVGAKGTLWTHVDLTEPMPNPLFDKAITYGLKFGLPEGSQIEKASGKVESVKQLSEVDIKAIYLGQQKLIVNGEELTGGEGLKKALSTIDAKEAENKVRDDLKKYISPKKGAKFNPDTANEKHLALRYFANLNERNIEPQDAYMLSKVPVIPAEFRRPIIRKDWNMSTPAVNDLYASLIGETNYLNSLKTDKEAIPTPEQIQDQRERAYQAFGALVGAKNTRPIGNFTSTSLLATLTNPQKLHASDEFGGRDTDVQSPKRGYIQQKVVKKSQELSGRSTIVPTGTVPIEGSDDLGPDEVGMPEEMAWKLYEPFVRKRLTQQMQSAGKANKSFKDRDHIARRALEETVKNHPVLVNRAPSWWPYNVMALDPVIMWSKKAKPGEKDTEVYKEKALRIPNMIVNSYFGGDYDGDAMSVHVPATQKAIEEARNMKPSQHLRAPGSGAFMIMPDQSQLLGLYFLTREDRTKQPLGPPKGVQTVQQLAESFWRPVNEGGISQDLVGQRYMIMGEAWTPGWAVVNEAIRQATLERNGVQKVFEVIKEDSGKEFTRSDFTINKKNLREHFIPALVKTYPRQYARIAQQLAKAGDESATRQGLSIGISDLKTPNDMVDKAIKDAEKLVPALAKQIASERGETLSATHREEALSTLMSAKGKISVNGKNTESASSKIESALKNMEDSDNSFIRMMQIGSKGNSLQIRQILGANLNVNNVLKGIESEPIKNNFAKGLKGGEYFIAQHGALSGLRDRAVETSAPGYLGKKIIMASQEMVVTEPDCHATLGAKIPIAKEDGSINMLDLEGRFDAKTGEEFTSAKLMELKRKGVKEVEARSPLFCRAKSGVCQKCYGRKTTTGEMPEIGFNAGVQEGQAIVQTSAHMTLKSFHTSGSADKGAPSFDRLEEIVELRTPSWKALLFDGPRGAKVTVLEAPLMGGGGARDVKYRIDKNNEVRTIRLRPGQELKRNAKGNDTIIKKNAKFEVGDPITEGHIDPMELGKLKGSSSLKGFEAQQDYLTNELHGMFNSMGSNFSRRTSETAVASMASYVLVRDPGDSKFFPFDKIKYGEAEAYNVEARKTGKKPIVYDRMVEPTRRVPKTGENWLAKLNFEGLKKSIVTGGIAGHGAPVHGTNPISSYMMGREFDMGDKSWQY